ncbi:hypothetical protein ACL2XG_10315 [Sodalis sp. RH24]|uniref:hypothetical protein n=1 Tax=unclassified Sodalis (in: enterobacteria) TaxID=2636512 RepID=UPI0039B45A06
MRWSDISFVSAALGVFADIGAGRLSGLPPAAGVRAKDRRFRPAQAPAREGTCRENEIVADAKIQLLGFYRRHPRMIVHNESAYIPLTYAALSHFVRQNKNQPLPELLAALARLIPGTDISPVRRGQTARANALRREISALNDFRARLAAARAGQDAGHIP